jgi:hypothetical protein
MLTGINKMVTTWLANLRWVNEKLSFSLKFSACVHLFSTIFLAFSMPAIWLVFIGYVCLAIYCKPMSYFFSIWMKEEMYEYEEETEHDRFIFLLSSIVSISSSVALLLSNGAESNWVIFSNFDVRDLAICSTTAGLLIITQEINEALRFQGRKD